MHKCCGCPNEINIEDGDHFWSATKEDYLCAECNDLDEQSLSTVTIVRNGTVKKCYIGEHTRMTEDGDDMYGLGIAVNRKWVSTDAWRGHFDTTIDGWKEVMNGWTAGGWGDEISNRKQTFNEWANDVCTGEITPPIPLAIVADPTSNVFSMGISLLTPEPELLKQWLDEDFIVIEDSLR